MSVLSSRNTRALAALAAAGVLGATTVALGAGGPRATRGAQAASASAVAYQTQDKDGKQQRYVSVSGTDSAQDTGTAVSTSTHGGRAWASARARMRAVSLFDGFVTADVVSVRATASGSSATKTGTVKHLVVNGVDRGTVAKRTEFDLAGYGKLVVLDGKGRGILGLGAKLTRDYRSYPAGTTLNVAYAAASARDAAAAPAPPAKPAKPAHRKPAPARPRPKAANQPNVQRRKAPRTKRLLTSQGFVFPVYGTHSFSDDYGAPRADTGFHQGNDIFATAGTPAVAVCDGSLNRVGTLPVSGNRLWVKCKTGDSFFYAHLSAFATDSRDGAKVTSGQVVGFVGSTGDAERTPPHVHFEVHPGDGNAVDPYPFLRAWESRRDVPAAAWVKANGSGAGQQPGTLVVVRDYLDR